VSQQLSQQGRRLRRLRFHSSIAIPALPKLRRIQWCTAVMVLLSGGYSWLIFHMVPAERTAGLKRLAF
jgi:hypothetical protein